MRLHVSAPASRLPERNYILDVVLRRFLGFEFDLVPAEGFETTITHGGKSIRLPDILLSLPEAQYLSAESLPQTPLPRFDAAPLQLNLDPLPVLFGSAEGLEVTDAQIRLPFDLFGSAFFMLTLYEEAVLPDRDHRDRFPAASALSVREGFIRRPIVNEMVEILYRCCERLWPSVSRTKRSYRLLPTHDIDVLLTSLDRRPAALAKALAADVLKRGDAGLALRRLRAFMTPNRSELDPCNNAGTIMSVAERVNVKAAFFFICGVRPDVRKAHYDPQHPVVIQMLKEIGARGHEYGLHPGYGSFRDSQALQDELQALRQSAKLAAASQVTIGGRQHGLQWENPTTWRLWEESGLAYDSSVGFSAAPGFRAGVCYEYPVFDLKERRALALLERPLIAMDTSYEDYLKMGPEAAHGDMVELAQTCRRFGGDFVGLWHNNRLISRSQLEWFKKTLVAAAPSGG